MMCRSKFVRLSVGSPDFSSTAQVFREMNGYGRLVARADAEVRALVEAEEGQAVWGTTKAIRLELVRAVSCYFASLLALLNLNNGAVRS